jgi:hypothetical protein
MAKNSLYITEDNMYEWLCSTGYLLPGSEAELARFELLSPPGSIIVNESAIDPFAIINGTRLRKPLSINAPTIATNMDVEELRMAARKFGNLPEDLLGQLKSNQEKKSGDGTKRGQEK